MNWFIHRTRRTLIEVGKAMPFMLCFLILLSYIEDVYALQASNFVIWDNCLIPNKTASWGIGSFFEYNLQTLCVITIISFAIETCYWNKLALLYLLIQLYEKNYFAKVELYPEQIYLVAIANILVSGIFTIKGLIILKQ